MAFTLVGAFKDLSLASSSSFLRGDRAALPGGTTGGVGVATLPARGLTIQMAHKKGAGSTKNGRDSKGQRLGVKIYGDQLAKPGAIIIRQRGTKVPLSAPVCLSVCTPRSFALPLALSCPVCQ